MKIVSLLLCAAFAFSSCSMMTARGRREASYQRFVRKHVKARKRAQAKLYAKQFHFPHLAPSQSSVTNTTVESPESVSPGGQN